MTLPQRTAAADPAPRVAPLLGLEALDGRDRGPANAVITRLAHAIAEQNVTNATDPALSEGYNRRVPRLGWLILLGAVSASLWFVAIMIGRALI